MSTERTSKKTCTAWRW